MVFHRKLLFDKTDLLGEGGEGKKKGNTFHPFILDLKYIRNENLLSKEKNRF